jgi:hypothetical protein
MLFLLKFLFFPFRNPVGQGFLIALALLFGFDTLKANQARESAINIEQKIGAIKSQGLLSTASQPVTRKLKRDYPQTEVLGVKIPMSESSMTQQVVFNVSAGVDLEKIQSTITPDREVVIKLPPVQITAVEQDYQSSQLEINKGLLSPSNPASDLYPILQMEKESVKKEACDRMSSAAIQNSVRVIGSLFGESIQVKVEPSTEQCITQ